MFGNRKARERDHDLLIEIKAQVGYTREEVAHVRTSQLEAVIRQDVINRETEIRIHTNSLQINYWMGGLAVIFLITTLIITRFRFKVINGKGGGK